MPRYSGRAGAFRTASQRVAVYDRYAKRCARPIELRCETGALKGLSLTGLLFRSSGGRCSRGTVGRRPILRAFGIGASILGVAGCRMPAIPSTQIDADRTVPVFVIAGGWHTELALPVNSLRGSLPLFAEAFPDARYLVFGWGQRDYYIAREPTIGDLLGAALPGPAVMLVVPLRQAPTNAYGSGRALSVKISEQGANALSGFIWRFLAVGADGRAVRIAPGPYPESVFYASSGTYSLDYTCNTWTATALKDAGLPIQASGVVFADQVTSQLRAIARLEHPVGVQTE